MRLVSILESGRQDILHAAGEFSPEQARTLPPGGGWSVLDCIEHVIAVEDRYLQWIENGSECAPRKNTEREIRLFTIIRSRLTKVESAEPVRPIGRFSTLAEAVTAFGAVRDRSVALAQERGDALYEVSVQHPYFGIVNGAEMIQLIDGHARRHADQIREISASVSVSRTA